MTTNSSAFLNVALTLSTLVAGIAFASDAQAQNFGLGIHAQPVQYVQTVQYAAPRYQTPPLTFNCESPAFWVNFGLGDVLGRDSSEPTYYLDALIGPAIVGSRGGNANLLLIPEFGYSLVSTSTPEENGESWSYAHYGTAGMALGLQVNDFRDINSFNLMVFVDALFGANDNGFSLGVRTGIRTSVLASVLGLEVSHQFTSDMEDIGHHNIRGMVILDGVALAVALIALGSA